MKEISMLAVLSFVFLWGLRSGFAVIMRSITGNNSLRIEHCQIPYSHPVGISPFPSLCEIMQWIAAQKKRTTVWRCGLELIGLVLIHQILFHHPGWNSTPRLFGLHTLKMVLQEGRQVFIIELLENKTYCCLWNLDYSRI